MNNWPFVIAAYFVGLGGTFALLLWAWSSMRKAESQASSLKRRP